MFAEMRRNEKRLSEEETIAVLKNAEYGVLATMNADGYPYGVPVSFVFIDENIYFHCAKGAGHKLENIKNNPKVSFTVVGNTEILPDRFSTRYESVIVFGEAKEASPQTTQKILADIVDKYSKGFEESGNRYIKAMLEKVSIYEVKIQHMTGKANQ